MSLGIVGLKQHVVEFISGASTGGIWTDGVRDTSQGTSGPYTWQVPNGVAELVIDGTGGGCSGAAGAYQIGALSAGGGAGASTGQICRNYSAKVVPKSTLTVTVAAGGTGSATNDGVYSNGGTTLVSGFLPNFFMFNGTMELRGGTAFMQAPTSSTSAVATQGGNVNTPGIDGQQGVTGDGNHMAYNFYYLNASNQGGGGKASGVAGGNGGYTFFGYSQHAQFPTAQANWFTVSTGTASGGGSWGAGGRGTPSYFSGVSPAGGNGDQIGTDAGPGDYGAGGGGGGGSGTARRRGGNGGNGYVRFTYWSMD